MDLKKLKLLNAINKGANHVSIKKGVVRIKAFIRIGEKSLSCTRFRSGVCDNAKISAMSLLTQALNIIV